MPTLIALLTTGKGSWKHLFKIIREYEWGKIIIVASKFVKENFEVLDERIVIEGFDFDGHPLMILNNVMDFLKKEIDNPFDVALNISSGNGKEHEILISALMLLGCTIKFVDYDEYLFILPDAYGDE